MMQKTIDRRSMMEEAASGTYGKTRRRIAAGFVFVWKWKNDTAFIQLGRKGAVHWLYMSCLRRHINVPEK